MEALTYHSTLQEISCAASQLPRGFFQDLPVVFFTGLVTRAACLDPATAGDVSGAITDLKDGPAISAIVEQLKSSTGARNLSQLLQVASSNPNDEQQKNRLAVLFRLVSLTTAGPGVLERAYGRVHRSLTAMAIDPVLMSIEFGKQSMPIATSVHRSDLVEQLAAQSRLAIGSIVNKLGVPGSGLVQKVKYLTTSEEAQFPVSPAARDIILTKLAALTTCVAINPNAYGASEKALISDLTETLMSDYLAPAPVDHALARLDYLEIQRQMGDAFPGDGPYR
jgi:hypothetical protein